MKVNLSDRKKVLEAIKRARNYKWRIHIPTFDIPIIITNDDNNCKEDDENTISDILPHSATLCVWCV